MSQRSTGTSCFRLPLQTCRPRRKQCCYQSLSSIKAKSTRSLLWDFVRRCLFFQSESKLAIKVTKAILVVRLVAVEIHSAIQPLLDHYLSPSGSFWSLNTSKSG